ncbi:hypothetical protein BC943DRAFT_371525 [Umbelopsis sp. AD052]|nr:hypothetical protein BC943DRAFT_371525 [Umbelopsis sp. AD052]
MSCFRRSNVRLRISVPKDFDINSIQKCPIDSGCDFIPLEDSAPNEDPNMPFVVLQEKYFIAHLAGHEFKLDIQGNPVEEDTDYILQLYDQPEDVIKDGDYGSMFYATYRLNRSEKIIVRYCIVDGIHYLTYHGKFLHADDTHGDELGYMEEEEKVPEKKNRVEFHVTENNTFKTAKWDTNIWLTFEKITLNHSSLKFDSKEEVMRWSKPLELTLTRV